MPDLLIESSSRDRELMHKHGYPLERLNSEMEKHAGRNGRFAVPITPFELEQLIGDLSRSCNDTEDEKLSHALSRLCQRLEADQRFYQRGGYRIVNDTLERAEGHGLG
ncbi:MAG: hypothetical protein JNJ88_17450 [Planctomycetes bacterium]|nr:hypothetical protein [Planctomycetota bacterium]